MPAPYTDTHDPSVKLLRKDSKVESLERTEKRLENLENLVIFFTHHCHAILHVHVVACGGWYASERWK